MTLIHIDDDLTRHGEQAWREQMPISLAFPVHPTKGGDMRNPIEWSPPASTSNWTGRTHRTMEDAFGPYTSRRLEPEEDEREPMTRRDRIMLRVALAVSALLSLGGLAWLIKAPA